MIDYSVSDGVCVLRLNSPPVNTITFSLLGELRASIARASSDAEVRGIVITGDARHFSAGADISIFREIAGPEDAILASQVFQEAFQEVEDSPKPVAAAVAGKVMGGALELAMACHLRVACEEARFSMQEVKLGINPGAGGTGRLPRLVGPERALKMLLTADVIDAQEALRLGLVDAVCRGEELLETARRLLKSACAPRKTSQRTEKVEDHAANQAAFREAERLLAGTRPEIIAPRKIIEAVKAGLDDSFQAGLLKEQTGFAQCMDTLPTQNKIYLFFATRETSKVPDLADQTPAPITKAAVIGMGTMGTGIAQALMLAGVPVVVRDEDGSALERGLERIRSSLQRRIARGKLSGKRAEEMLRLVSTAVGWEEIAGADLVIEAVFEDVRTKKLVLGEIERVCDERAIIASNTSTISLDVLADAMQHAQRLVGMHFFNPAHRMPLVEIIRREGTSPGVVAAALAFARKLRKTPVVVNSREGFLVNRVFLPYLKEAFWLLEEGADAPAIDSAMVEFGFPMGPLTLTDMAGLDVIVPADRVLCRAFPRHGPLSQIALRLVDGGHLGQKRGSGVYKYEEGDYTPHRSEAAERIIAQVRKDQGRVKREIDGHEITRRLVLRMVCEAFYVMEEGVAQRESDLDVAMQLGTGFPDFRGGVLKYAHDLGLSQVAVELDALAEKCGERFSPSGLLQESKGA